MTVSVLIPAFNEVQVVRQTVLPVRQALSDASIEHEIIVIDAGFVDVRCHQRHGYSWLVVGRSGNTENCHQS